MPFGNARGQGFNDPVLRNYWIGNTNFNNGNIFQYEPSPGFGNLVLSVAPIGGTDKFGNVYLPGTVTYLSGTSAFAIAGGSCAVWTAPGAGGPWTSQGGIAPVAGGGIAISGTILEITAPVFGNIPATQPGTTTLETWHSLALTTITGSGNGVNGFRYKAMAINCLLLEWDINTNSVGNAVTVATLPAAWRPATAHNIASGTYGGTVSLTTAVNPHWVVNTNGTIVTGATGANAFSMCGAALIGLD